MDFYYSAENSDLLSNGGIVTGIRIIRYEKNNLLPDVLDADIDVELNRLRKFFLVSDAMLDVLKVLVLPSPADDSMLINTGTDDDTQADAEGYSSWKGCGKLKVPLSMGLITSLIVEAEVAGIGFQVSDLIRIADTGFSKEDFIRIQSVSWDGKEATITPVAPALITSNYLVDDYVSACLELNDVQNQAIWVKEIILNTIEPYVNNFIRLIFKGKAIT